MHNNGFMLSRSYILVVTLLLFAIGCGSENKLGRVPVSGKILLDGQPLDHGTILFAPEQRNGVSTGAPIEAGAYAIPEQQGLTPGSYAVRIYAADEEADAVAPEVPGPGIKTQPERIPAKYNMRSDLKVQVAESDKTVTFDLDMEPK